MMHSQSFIDFLADYDRLHPPAERYEPGMEFSAWKEGFLARMHALRGPLPSRCPLSIEAVTSTPCADHTRHEVSIRVSEISTLPAYLLVPHHLRPGEKRAGILALHGHTKFGCETIAGVDRPDVQCQPFQAYGLDAVRAGHIVLAPACWGFPGRDGHEAQVSKGHDKCNAIQTAAQMYGLNVLALHLQDGQAALDALAQHPHVDPSRLGCIGNSYGGRMAMWLTAFDDRIKACVASGCMNTLRERAGKLRSCAIQYLPGILQYGDVAEIFSTIAPRALQLMGGTADGLLDPQDMQQIHQAVQAAYRAADADDQYDYVLHAMDHRLVWELAASFLEKHLGQETSFQVRHDGECNPCDSPAMPEKSVDRGKLRS